MILDLVFWPDTRLKQLCEPVPEVTDAVRWLIREMEETLVFARAAGLAAPQVGRALRVVTVRENDTGKPVSLVNPRIVELSPERLLMREGCLSLPGYWEKVSRAVWARVEGLNAHGEPVELQESSLGHTPWCDEAVCRSSCTRLRGPSSPRTSCTSSCR